MRINTHSMQRWAMRPAVVAGSLMFALAVPGIAIAQGDDENTPGAVGCAITAQLLLLPSGADRYGRLLNRTQSCASAAEMFVSAWGVAPADWERLDLLAYHSGVRADRRILDVVLSVLADPTRSVAQRRAALKTIVKLVAPSKWISDDVWATPSRFSISTSAHVFHVVGAIPLSTEARVRAAAAVRTASISDGDAALRSVAAWLRRELPAEFGDTCATATVKAGQAETASICVPAP